MHKQPAMQHMMHALLTIEPALLITEAFEIRQLRPEAARNLHTQLSEHAGRLDFIGKRTMMAARVKKKGAQLLIGKICHDLACELAGT